MSIKARIEIDNSELKNGLKDAENQASKSMKNIKGAAEQTGGVFGKLAGKAQAAAKAIQGGFNGVVSSVGKLGPVGAAAAAAIATIGIAVAGTFKFVGNFANKLNDIGKAAKSVNMTANQYIALKHASSVAGVEMEKVLGIINKIDFALTHAEAGEKKYLDAFHALGLSWEQLQRLSPLQMMNAVADAYKRITSNGGQLPTEFYDLFSKKDIQTFNKMAKENFSKLTAEAGVLGLNLDEEQIRRMEAYNDRLQETKDRLLKINAELDKSIGLSELWDATMKRVNENLTDGMGIVNKEFRGQWEGYADIGNDLIKRQIYNQRQGQGDALSTDDMRTLLKYMEADIKTPLGSITNPAMPNVPTVNFARAQYDKMTEAEIRHQFTEKFERFDIEKTDKEFRKALLGVVSKYEKNIKVDDPNTWTRMRTNATLPGQATPEQIAKEKIEAEAKRLNLDLLNTISQYDKILDKSGKLVDIERKIEELNKKINEETNGQVKALDEQIQRQLRKNAAKQNELTLETEIRNLKKLNASNVNSTLSQLIARTGGPDAGTMRQVITTLEEYGPKLLGNEYNFQEQFVKGLLESFNSRMIAGAQAKSLDDMLNNPMGLQSAFEDIAKVFNTVFKTPEKFLKDRTDLSDAERKKVTAAFEQLDKMIENANNASRLEKSFNMLSEIDDLHTALAMLDAQIDNDARVEDSLKFKTLLKQMTGKFGKQSPSSASNEEIVYADMINQLNNLKEAKQTMLDFKTKERDLKGQIDLQHAEAFGLKNQLETQKRLTVLREMNIKLTDENIKKWWAAAGVIVRLNDELEYKQKLEVANDRAEASRVSLSLQKALISGNEKLIKQKERENWLIENGIKNTKENLKLYKNQIDEAMKLKEAQKNFDVNKSLLDKTIDLHLSNLEKVGQGEYAEVYRVLKEMQDMKGSPLSREQVELGRRYAKNKYWLDNAQRPDIPDDIVVTNDLARKGGWNSSVVVQRNDTNSILREFENLFKQRAQDNFRILSSINSNLKN